MNHGTTNDRMAYHSADITTLLAFIILSTFFPQTQRIDRVFSSVTKFPPKLTAIISELQSFCWNQRSSISDESVTIPSECPFQSLAHNQTRHRHHNLNPPQKLPGGGSTVTRRTQLLRLIRIRTQCRTRSQHRHQAPQSVPTVSGDCLEEIWSRKGIRFLLHSFCFCRWFPSTSRSQWSLPSESIDCSWFWVSWSSKVGLDKERKERKFGEADLLYLLSFFLLLLSM